MHIEVDRLADPAARAELAAGIERVLGDVRAAVTDWKAMVAQLRAVIEEIDRQPPPLPREEVAENRAFLQWLTEDHLLLLGYRCHDLTTVDGEDALRLVPGSGLGILRESATETALSSSFAVLPPQARAVAHAVSPMMFVTKANSRSTVHRPGYIDYIGVKRYKDGVVIGEHRFVGLFTSAAYTVRVAEVPDRELLLERSGDRGGQRFRARAGQLSADLDRRKVDVRQRRRAEDGCQRRRRQAFRLRLDVARLGRHRSCGQVHPEPGQPGDGR